jgi:hypothetical protein
VNRQDMKLERVSLFCYIAVFCNWSCSFATDIFGLYCRVNRQDMKVDGVSVFCYNSVFCYIAVFCNKNCSLATGI